MTQFKFGALNLCSINVRAIRNHFKRKAVFLFCRRYSTDFIFLQETYSCKEDEKFWKSQWGDGAYFSHGSNHSAGVAVLLNNTATVLLCW